ncbi:MAG: preprotein translocase subunit YajC [Acidimicrobiia bacterium]|nr:preprotein translocase subunit YajC [Acidimicrobiia bacterium]
MEPLIPLILIGGVMYLVLILPQQRRNKEHKALLASLEVGDEVVMNSGIHGFVSAVDADILWIEVAPNTELKVSKSAIAGKIQAPDDEEDDSADDSADDPTDDTAEDS